MIGEDLRLTSREISDSWFEDRSHRIGADVEPSGKDTATETNAFIDRISVTSAKEIAKLIAELQNLRDFLHSEGQRVHREISGYVHLNEAAVKAT